MNSRIVAIGSWLFLSALAGCSGDNGGSPDVDAGTTPMDSGMGGTGGTAGAGHGGGGSGGASAGGTGGTAGGSGGAGGTGGSGGAAGATYSVGGNVTGLNGSGLVVKLNGSEELKVSGNGSFTFEMLLAKGDSYSVSVATQPSNPSQACAVENGAGKVGSSDVSDIKISCSNVVKSVGGAVSGLGGGQIKLKNNGGDELTLTQDGNFTFATLLDEGADYAVTVSAPPSGRTCSVSNGSGKVGTSNVTDVKVDCYAGMTLSTRARVGSVELTWSDNGATSYTAYLSTDPACTFDTPTSCADFAQQGNVTSPYMWGGLQNGKTYYFQILGNHPNSFHTHSNVSGARPNTAEFDQPVDAIALGNSGSVYVGGEFNTIGTYTGPLVPLDMQTARPTRMPNFPIVVGSVGAVAPDGSGGYFVGGAFTQLGSVTIHNLAHVLSTGAVDETWKPEPDNAVTKLTLAGNTLYVAGAFTMVGGKSRAGLAALDATGAGAASDWNPAPDNAVNAIAVSGSTVYVGGDFQNVGGAARSYLAALDATTGTAAAGFDPSPNLRVLALALSADTLYVSGYFDMIAGQQVYKLAALDFSGAARSFPAVADMPVDNPPNAMALSGSTLYLGGNFTTINGQARERLAALDATSGVLSSWAPGADAVVQALAVSGSTIYVAGEFTMIAGAERKYLAAVDDQGGLTSWDPRPSGLMNVLAVDSNTVYASGNLVRTYGAEAHSRLASFKQGVLSTWDPQVTGGDVLALAAAGGTVYVGGNFDHIGGVARNAIAAVNASGTVKNTWDAQMNSNASVNALLVDSTRVYAGGQFSAAGGGAHDNLVALTDGTGDTLSGWTLSGADGEVDALAIDGSTLYLGGTFQMVGSDARSRLAAVDAAVGTVQSWSPSADGSVRALAVINTDVIVGGDFSNLDMAAHGRLGAIDNAGTVYSWNPDVNDSVRALATSGNILYIGGDFDAVGVITRQHFAAIDTSNNAFSAPVDGTPNVLYSIHALAADDTQVYLGGYIVSVGGSSCRNYCTTPLWTN